MSNVVILFIGSEGSGRALLKGKIQSCLKDYLPRESSEPHTVNGQQIDKGHTLSFSTDVIVRKLVKKQKPKKETNEQQSDTRHAD